MDNRSSEMTPLKRRARVIVPVLIILAISAIWFVKNSRERMPSDTVNPDFALHVTEKLDLEHLKCYGLPIMIDFGADSCIPCKEMAPVLEKLNKSLQGKAIIKFVDVGKNPELARDYPIRVIPTQFFFDKDGKPFTPSDPESMQMLMYVSRETEEHVFTAHEGGMTEEMILSILKEMGVEP